MIDLAHSGVVRWRRLAVDDPPGGQTDMITSPNIVPFQRSPQRWGEPDEEPFDPINDLVERWCREVTDTVANFDDCYGHSRVDEVENRARDGFIPYTDGGWDGIAYAALRNAHGSGSAPAAIQPYIDSELKQIAEAWDEQNPDHPYEWIFGPDPEDEGQLSLEDEGQLLGPSREREHWKEKYWEFEDNSMEEGGTYFYKVRALYLGTSRHSNETGEPEVLFCVALNTDFEYGRDNIPWLACYGAKTQQSEWVWEQTVPVAQINEELIERFTNEAIEALRKL